MKGGHHAKTRSYFAVVNACGTRMPYSCELGRGCRRLGEIVKQMLGLPVDARSDALRSRCRSPAARSGNEAKTRGPRLCEAKPLIISKTDSAELLACSCREQTPAPGTLSGLRGHRLGIQYGRKVMRTKGGVGCGWNPS